MRKVITFVGAAALFAAGLLVGSQTTLFHSQANTASLVGVAPVMASKAAITLSPLQMMIENKNTLPKDEFSDLY